MNININPMNFLNNMHYMGTGMLSIFLVIGVIIVVTYIINKIASRNK
ncbi:MAG: oxaloacetate decarboxylase [Clostridia bacterium]|nr:oxaloacetate decarboxylase [Clostridia bacterium]